MGYTIEQEVAWCKQIIKNIGLTMYRKKQRRSRQEVSLDAILESGSQPDIAQSISHDSERPFHSTEWLIVFDELLSTDERCIVRNLFWSGFSQRETARVCNLSQSGVSRRLHVALTKIKRAVVM